jgi:oligoendopeptidase F
MSIHIAVQTPAPPSQPAEPPTWSLADLYAGPGDPALDRDLDAARAAVEELMRLKGAFVAARGRPERLGLLLSEGIGLYERATDLLLKPAAYASLAASIARDDAALAKAEGDLRTRTASIAADTVFLTLEINQLEEWEIEAGFRADPNAGRWRPWVRRARLMRDHELSPDLERLLIDRGPGVANWSRLFDETLARLRVSLKGESLTLSEALNLLSDPAPKRRKAVATALAEALEATTAIQSLCLNTLAFEKQVEDRWRKFGAPSSSRHIANEVDAEAVDALEAAVVEAYPKVSHRYYALKAKAMGLEALDYWDRNAPLDQAPARRYGWDEAKEIVLSSFTALSPAFAEKARRFFDNPWIDAKPQPGKASGAYSHPVCSIAHPYVFMNFMGERRDVLTLAHELGHAVHQTMAAPLGTLLSDTPLTMAETASIFGEGLVFERLLAEAPPAARRLLLAGKIEDGEVTAQQIGAIWLEVMSESLGPAVRMNAGYEHYWAYVSHFVHAPFYVYAYAFGDLLVSALMERRRQDPAAFAPLYEALLSAGGAKTYVEALQPFGMNPREKSFWAEGCTRLERLVDEFEALGEA